MSNEAFQIERRIQEALAAYNCGAFTTLGKAATAFDVPYRKLVSRRNGAQPKSSNGGNGRKLSEEQEMALCNWIDQQNRFGFPPRFDHIEQAANRILRLGNTSNRPPPEVGSRWASRFVQRHPKYTPRKSQPLEVERLANHDPKMLAEWFDKFEAIKKEEGILDKDIYNMDETGYFAGTVKQSLVIVPKADRAAYIQDPHNRDWITAVEAISGDGYSPPPMIILKGSVHLATWYSQYSNLPNNYSIGLSNSGYINSDLAMEWLRRFEEVTRKRTEGKCRLLLLDGHESHVTVDFIDFCHSHNIWPMCLPPHTTHLIQPLDLVIFRSVKHWQARAVEAWTRLFNTSFSKIDFLDTYPGVREAAFSSKNISSAWNAAGLIPFNPAVVLEKVALNDKSEQAPSFNSNSQVTTVTNILATPQNTKDILRQSRYLQDVLADGLQLTDRKRKAMEKLLMHKRVEILKGQQAVEEMEAIHEATMKISKRKKTAKRWQLQRGGVLGVGEARELHSARAVVELNKKQRADEREEKKLLQLLKTLARAATKDQSEKRAFRMAFRRDVALGAAAKGRALQARMGA
jgi:hypothetical protein